MRQEDIISPKLFTLALALEDVFRILGWNGFGININGEYITHLRFADDIVKIISNVHVARTLNIPRTDYPTG